jgi:hypothetical protein
MRTKRGVLHEIVRPNYGRDVSDLTARTCRHRAEFWTVQAREGTPQVPTIKVRTKLVLIPAVVADAKGNRVTDLKKGEFGEREHGKYFGAGGCGVMWGALW